MTGLHSRASQPSAAAAPLEATVSILLFAISTESLPANMRCSPLLADPRFYKNDEDIKIIWRSYSSTSSHSPTASNYWTTSWRRKLHRVSDLRIYETHSSTLPFGAQGMLSGRFSCYVLFLAKRVDQPTVVKADLESVVHLGQS